jgi:hypothetical protein
MANETFKLLILTDTRISREKLYGKLSRIENITGVPILAVYRPSLHGFTDELKYGEHRQNYDLFTTTGYTWNDDVYSADQVINCLAEVCEIVRKHEGSLDKLVLIPDGRKQAETAEEAGIKVWPEDKYASQLEAYIRNPKNISLSAKP